MFKELSPKECEELLKEVSNSMLLDVRTESEWDNFHIDKYNVKLIPVDELDTRYGELGKDKLIVVTCRAGVRGAAASGFLSENGFNNVVNVHGGLLEWNNYLYESKQESEEEFQKNMMALMRH